MTASIIVSATYRARADEDDEVAQALQAMVPYAREEPGCIHYLVHRGDEDRRSFLIYEKYRSAADFEHHKASEPFGRIIRDRVWPALDSRVVSFWEELDA